MKIIYYFRIRKIFIANLYIINKLLYFMIKTLSFPNLDLSKYHSQTQKIKHLTEGYVFENAFCPADIEV